MDTAEVHTPLPETEHEQNPQLPGDDRGTGPSALGWTLVGLGIGFAVVFAGLSGLNSLAGDFCSDQSGAEERACRAHARSQGALWEFLLFLAVDVLVVGVVLVVRRDRRRSGSTRRSRR